MKSWVGLVGWPIADDGTVYLHKWSPVSCRSSAGQGKFAGQRPTFYNCAPPPVDAGCSSFPAQFNCFAFKAVKEITEIGNTTTVLFIAWVKAAASSLTSETPFRSSNSSSSLDFMGWVSCQLLLPNSLLSMNLPSLFLKTSNDGASTTSCGNRFQHFTTLWLKKHILHCFSDLFLYSL